MNFNPNQMNFNPNQMNFDPNQMNYNPNQMNFDPMQMNMQMQMILQMQNQMQNNIVPNYNNNELEFDSEKESIPIFNCLDDFEKILSEITDKKIKINFVDTKNNKITKNFPIYF